MLKKTITLKLLLILGISNIAWAVSDSSATNSTWPAYPQSKAIEFARQAGAIAGVVHACGQNVGSFTQRISEAINKLSINPTDKAGAMLIYQQIANEAQVTQQKMQNIPCTKVLQDYQSLPIMQSDYQEKVITQLNSSEP